ncbi:hypothetical protein DSECCO2_365360 [anaerobic digester metagenome]
MESLSGKSAAVFISKVQPIGEVGNRVVLLEQSDGIIPISNIRYTKRINLICNIKVQLPVVHTGGVGKIGVDLHKFCIICDNVCIFRQQRHFGFVVDIVAILPKDRGRLITVQPRLSQSAKPIVENGLRIRIHKYIPLCRHRFAAIHGELNLHLTRPVAFVCAVLCGIDRSSHFAPNQSVRK